MTQGQWKKQRKRTFAKSEAPKVPGLVPFGWYLYFSEDFRLDHPILPVIEKFLDFFQSIDSLSPTINYSELKNFLTEDGTPPEFLENFWRRPEESIPAIGLALFQMVYAEEIDARLCQKIEISIKNFTPITPVRQLKSNLIGSLISLRGTVVRVGAVRPLVRSLEFECGKCENRIRVVFTDGIYQPPFNCQECGYKTLHPLRSSAVFSNYQMLRLQESIFKTKIPRTIEVEVMDHLIDKALPGDEVEVVGVVKVFVDSANDGMKSGSRNLFVVYLHTQSLWHLKSASGGGSGSLSSPSISLTQDVSVDVEFGASSLSNLSRFSTKDVEFVRKLASQPNLLRLIVNSLCPGICGHELVKLSLLLSLFSGVSHFLSSSDNSMTTAIPPSFDIGSSSSSTLSQFPDISHEVLTPFRGDIHTLIMGDPGLGKSQLLQAVSSVAPRGCYVSGSTTTSSGLTVVIVRDATSGEWCLEAGALPLANGGCVCIDEFDKMSSQHPSLLECMESQMCSVSKAGITASLPSRCALIAAANPKGGHWQKGKTLTENTKISPALLSRFDIIAVMIDKPDSERDLLLSSHLLRVHAGLNSHTQAISGPSPMLAIAKGECEDGGENEERGRSKRLIDEEEDIEIETIKREAEMISRREAVINSIPLEEQSLSMRIVGPVPRNEIVPRALLRKYIAYARKNVSPQLSQQSKEEIERYYVHRRNTDPNCSPRLLFSLIRLSEARARLELRFCVSLDDTLDVIELLDSVSSSCNLVVDDEEIAVDPKTHRRSKNRDLQRLISKMKKESERNMTKLFHYSEIRSIAASLGIRLSIDMMNTLNQNGFLLLKADNFYELRGID